MNKCYFRKHVMRMGIVLFKAW